MAITSEVHDETIGAVAFGTVETGTRAGAIVVDLNGAHVITIAVEPDEVSEDDTPKLTVWGPRGRRLFSIDVSRLAGAQ